MLLDINKANDYTATQLKDIWDTAFTTSSKYGKKAGNYFADFNEISQYGYPDSKAVTEFLMLTQSAGGLTQNLAKQYLLTSDEVYGYQGNIQKLNSLLDSQHQVSLKSSVSMVELTKASVTAAAQMKNANLSEQEITALLSTGISASKKSGELVGNSLANVIRLLQGASDIDFYKNFMNQDELIRAKERLDSLGISITEIKNGSEHLRNPMDILNELSKVYNSLPKDSEIRTKILFDLGETDHSGILASTLGNMESYQSIFDNFTDASGSATTAATKQNDSLHELSNTWRYTVDGFANSSGFNTGIKALNGLLNVVNSLRKTFGTIGTIGIGAALFGGIKGKNVGKHFHISIIDCLKIEYAPCYKIYA